MKNLFFLMLVILVFASCAKEEDKMSEDIKLDLLLKEYPSEMTPNNYLEFMDAPKEIIDYFNLTDGGQTSPAIAVEGNLPTLSEDEIITLWTRGASGENRSSCDCSYITGNVAYDDFHFPQGWVGQQYGDVSFSSSISSFDLFILSRILADFDDDEDGYISNPNHILHGTASYDYDRDGDCDSEDRWAAHWYAFYISNIAGSDSTFGRDDIECIRMHILNNISC